MRGNKQFVEEKFAEFDQAARGRNLNQLQRILHATDGDTQQLLFRHNACHTFRWSAYRGHLKILEIFCTLANDKTKQKMLSSKQYSVFWECVKSGKLEIVKLLFDIADAESKKQMIVVHDYRGFNWAKQSRNDEMQKLILTEAIRLDLTLYEKLCEKMYSVGESKNIQCKVESEFEQYQKRVIDEVDAHLSPRHQIPLGRLVLSYLFDAKQSKLVQPVEPIVTFQTH